MSKIRTSLVLEGGGMRGAYTAGALSWLIDNNIEFDNAYGISTGALHLCTYLLKSKGQLFDFSVDGIRDKRCLFLNAFLRCGRIVDYDFLFDVVLMKEKKFDFTPLKDVKTAAFVGLYGLDTGKTEYTDVQSLTVDELKASTSLPIIGKPVKCEGREFLDGGITDMIPIQKAVDDGCNRHLIIATKPLDYVRKPAKAPIIALMKLTYPQCPQIAKDYKIRHINYQKQIKLIEELVNKGEAYYCYPSATSSVTRMGGKREDLIALYELGYSDMEERKEEIFKLLEK